MVKVDHIAEVTYALLSDPIFNTDYIETQHKVSNDKHFLVYTKCIGDVDIIILTAGLDMFACIMLFLYRVDL